MKKILFTLLFLTAFVPAGAYAQVSNNNTNTGGSSINNNQSSPTAASCSDPVENISDVLNMVGCIIRSALIPLLITLSVIVFIIGIIKYIAGADEATKREEGRNFMIYGIVALFVIVSVWGLVGVIQGTFGLGNSIYIPQMQGI
jgi:hypothetical protein